MDSGHRVPVCRQQRSQAAVLDVPAEEKGRARGDPQTGAGGRRQGVAIVAPDPDLRLGEEGLALR